MSNKHEGEYITIGKYYIEWDEQGKLWIELSDDSGEGGQFNATELEKVIGNFMTKTSDQTGLIDENSAHSLIGKIRDRYKSRVPLDYQAQAFRADVGYLLSQLDDFRGEIIRQHEAEQEGVRGALAVEAEYAADQQREISDDAISSMADYLWGCFGKHGVSRDVIAREIKAQLRQHPTNKSEDGNSDALKEVIRFETSSSRIVRGGITSPQNPEKPC